MKQSEFVADRLLFLAAQVGADKRNAQHALAEGSLLVDASEVAFKESRHMAFQKKKPRVKFFDSHIKVELTVEQKNTVAAKTLAKARAAKTLAKARAAETLAKTPAKTLAKASAVKRKAK